MTFRPLAEHETIVIMAPAGPAPDERVVRGLAVLRAHHPHVDLRYVPERGGPLPYLAADDHARAAAFERALGEPRAGAVLFVRGGYGCARLLGALGPGAGKTLQARRLPLAGFSDITALHCWAARLGVPSVHGPVLTQLGDLDHADAAALVATLRGSPPALDDLTRLVEGDVDGRLVGGNLTVLASLAGTAHALDARDAIVVLEDVGESPYRLDRCVTQLVQAGCLDGARAIVLGDFTRCDTEEPTPHRAIDALRERLLPLDLPLAIDAPIGHGARNTPVVLGARYRLEGSYLRPEA
ncbi:MAG: LD-carboxypeptidase [Myxococcales bacterium]|nr:LD-carboxypeptidase [Myxococcales bacterium]